MFAAVKSGDSEKIEHIPSLLKKIEGTTFNSVYHVAARHNQVFIATVKQGYNAYC